MTRKMILLELNEVPFKVIDYFVNKHPNSALAFTLSKSKQYVTYTEDKGHLHPWSTWPTVHRGVDNQTHQIKDFGENLDDLNKKYPAIWQILNQSNINTGVFGSLHSYPLPKNVNSYSFYIPDTFAWGPETHPKNIEAFQAFNLSMVKSSARNVNSGLDKKAALRFGAKIFSMGVRNKTLLSVVDQLISEKISPWKVTRRRSFQSIVGFDIFLKQLKKNKPDFCTFFSNHVAATMHRYWAATFPEDYDEFHLSEEWKLKYQGEIEYAMLKFDAFLKDILSFISKNPSYKLIIASSMGQESTKAIEQKSELMAKNSALFLSKFGIQSSDYQELPAMHPQYNFTFHSDNTRQKLIDDLLGFKIKGNPVKTRTKDNGFLSIDFGHINLEDGDISLNEKPIKDVDFGLENVPIQEEASGTAYHTSEGSLIIYSAQYQLVNTRQEGVNTKSIAPSILKYFKLNPPDYMRKDTIPEIVG